MVTAISAVDLVVAEDAAAGTPILDVPLGVDDGAGDRALDAAGPVHCAGPGGAERTT